MASRTRISRSCVQEGGQAKAHVRGANGNGIAIRGFEPDDARHYVDLLVTTSQKEYSGCARSEIAGLVARLPKRHIMVASTRGSERAGFVTAVPEGPVLHLLLLDVRPDQQGKGIGSILLRTVIGEARRTGKRAVLCEVWDGNKRGLGLYARHGFEKAKFIYNYYQNGLSAWLMVRSFENTVKKKEGREKKRDGRTAVRKGRPA
jgi:ribosomal-protein-alanine N-acetyltransferase